MYDAILHSDLVLPENFISLEAQDILVRVCCYIIIHTMLVVGT